MGVIYNMKKILLLALCFTLFGAIAIAQDFKNHVMTMAGFDAVQVDDEDFVLSPSARLQFMRIKQKDVVSPLPDMMSLSAGYSQKYFTAGLGPDKVNSIHACNFMGMVAKEKNSGMLMLMSSGEVPFSSMKSTIGIAMYNHKMIEDEHHNFSLGVGVIAGEFHIKQWDFTFYVFPLPTFSYTYKDDSIRATIAVQGPPTISVTLFPEAMVNFTGSVGMAGVDSIRDITFDCAMVVHPLFYTDKNFISVSAGIMNSKDTTVLKDKKEYAMQYYTVYGEIDAMLAKLRCGYHFNGKSYVDDDEVGNLKNGLFASINVMCMF